MSAEPVYAAPALDYSIRNRGFTYVVKALTDDARTAFPTFRPDIERERDGRVPLSADELSEFEGWASARGLSHFTYMSE